MPQNHLQMLRKERGLTQQNMADTLGMSKVNYSYIERGLRNLSYDTAVRIAGIFGKKPDDIFLQNELTKH